MNSDMLPEKPSYVIRGDDGAEYGPVDLPELREWVRENRAGLGTEVRRNEPGSPWNPWQSYPELVALLAEAAASAPAAASLFKRALALAMDLVLSGVLSFPVLFTLAIVLLPDWCAQVVRASLASVPVAPPELPTEARVIGSLVSDLIFALYLAGFHAAHGYTPGKALMHLRVVDAEGSNPGFVRGFSRALVLIVSMNFFFIPFLYVFFNPQRRALHVVVADTTVVDS